MNENQTYEEIFIVHKNDVYNFLLYYMKTADVDDVFQETFFRAHHALKNNTVSNVRLWLITIARNAAINHQKKRFRYIRKLDKLHGHRSPNELTLEEQFHLDQRKHMILSYVNKLKDHYKEVIVLRGIKEFSVSETAEIFNWNENKVNATYHRALKKLRALIDQGGVDREPFDKALQEELNQLPKETGVPKELENRILVSLEYGTKTENLDQKKTIGEHTMCIPFLWLLPLLWHLF